jgi:putative tryptophan/tyrosine transport system substrate-binding protein
VDEIRKRANPADLPVEQLTKLEFVFNLKNGERTRARNPREFLLLADEAIE